MTEDELKDRTKAFALRVLKLIDALPDARASRKTLRARDSKIENPKSKVRA